MMRLPSVFVRDKETGLAIPQLDPEVAGWIQDSPGKSSILITVMIDGINCKIQKGARGDTVLLRRSNVAGSDVRPYVVCDRTRSEDGPFFEAMDNLFQTATEGEYVAYGPSIKNNAQHVDKHMMIKVEPIDNCLILYGQTSGIKRWAVDVQIFYDSCKEALAEGDALGVVFRMEEPTYKLKAAAKVTRLDFGLPWPLPNTKKCLIYGCSTKIPVEGPAYCEKCRGERGFGGTSGTTVLKTCLGAGCRVTLAGNLGDYCSSCKGRNSAVGFLTGKVEEVPSV